LDEKIQNEVMAVVPRIFLQSVHARGSGCDVAQAEGGTEGMLKAELKGD
jgi:hypothetical protein